MMTANEIRDSFKKFFESKGHTIVPSAPMVIKDDPTLMFTNAGMNQWKDIILGTREPEPRRRADTQKCLRVSGKHNDLEEVGHDTYHHTMFEMLGNWSFGDYFKEGAIDYAWEYLVDVLKLNPADLYVTVFEGSEEEGLKRDDEAASYWAKHVPADHIINGNKHDNFWEMGDTGPCGPCSEIHLDSRTPEEKAKVPGRELKGVHFALELLAQQNRVLAGQTFSNKDRITAKGKRVLVIGGGDTGSDCIGTSNRQGALSVTQIEIMPKPPEGSNPNTPWPDRKSTV